jgi:hypothetical protein
MQTNTISDFRRATRIGPYAWPGGYPLYFITNDGGAISWDGAKQDRRDILESIRDNDSRGWRVVAMEINYEDGDLYCDVTGERIESAYAEDD